MGCHENASFWKRSFYLNESEAFENGFEGKCRIMVALTIVFQRFFIGGM